MRRLATCGTVVLLAAVGAASCLPGEAQSGRPRSDERTLSGRVFNKQDEPLQKAVVYLKNTKSLVVKTYISDPDGTYRFPALSPNVDYEVYAEFEGVRSDTKTLSAFDSRKQANITLHIHSSK